MLVLLFNPSRVGQALGQIRDPNARVSFSPLDPVMGRIAGEFGAMWEILTPTHTGLSLHEEREKKILKNSFRSRVRHYLLLRSSAYFSPSPNSKSTKYCVCDSNPINSFGAQLPQCVHTTRSKLRILVFTTLAHTMWNHVLSCEF